MTSMVYQERALHNYFTPHHWKYSGRQFNATYVQRMMGRLNLLPSNVPQLSCILFGCIFYGIVQIDLAKPYV